jgi:hypothetical protein
MSAKLHALTAYTLKGRLILNQDWSRGAADATVPDRYRGKKPMSSTAQNNATLALKVTVQNKIFCVHNPPTRTRSDF